jgi:hypothetical protein
LGELPDEKIIFLLEVERPGEPGKVDQTRRGAGLNWSVSVGVEALARMHFK